MDRSDGGKGYAMTQSWHGLDESRLESRLRAIYAKEGAELSGLAVALLEGGRLASEPCFGFRHIDAADPSLNLPVEPDTKFRVASISKSVVAIGAMILVERGLLDLDRDLSDYLGFELRNPSFPGDAVTAAMLLSHTSSVRDSGGYIIPLPYTLEDFVVHGIEGVGALRWATPIDGRDVAPGRYFCYSNLNYGILATVMERVSGARFDRYMRDAVLSPLGIDGSFNVLDLTDEGFSKLAALYRKAGDDESWRPDGPWIPQIDDYRGLRPPVACRIAPGFGPELLDGYRIGTNGSIFSPQGGLRISARDLSKIMRVLMNGGESDGCRLLSRGSVELMMTTRWAYDAKRRNGEIFDGLIRETALGLMRTNAARDEYGGDRLLAGGGPRLIGHHADAYGLLGGMLFDPREGFGFAYLIGGTACAPAKLRGRYSSWFIWEEEIQAALLEESGYGRGSGGHSGAADARSASTADADYNTGLWLWRGALGELGCFSLDGLLAERGALVFDAPNAARHDGELVAQAISPELLPGFPVYEVIPSWNADTPELSRIEMFLRAKSGGEWSCWFALGEWCSGSASFRRRSIDGQDDADGTVKTDTLVLASPAEALQMRVRFVVLTERANLASEAGPVLHNLALAYSSSKTKAASRSPATGLPSCWGRTIDSVPSFSQMVYPDGGNTWCSPTCVAMMLAFWNREKEEAEACVRRAVAGVYDETWGGCGNWSFNTAYAGALGFDAFVARFTSLADLEPLIGAGIPVAMSVSWNETEGRALAGAPVPRSAGHLTLLVGFDASGNPVMNEPAAREPSSVRRGYGRAELEARWLEASGGTVYVIVPRGKAVPGLP